MNPAYKDGLIRTIGDVICLCSIDGELLHKLYNHKNEEYCCDGFNVYMPDLFYVPTSTDQYTRYLIHNDDIISTLA